MSKTTQYSLDLTNKNGKLIQVNANEDGFDFITQFEGVASIIEKTYDEIQDMLDPGTLIPGQLYMISDFQTVHYILDGRGITETGEINTGETEPLILTATSNNTFHKQAYSVNYPMDIIYYDMFGQEGLDGKDIAFFDLINGHYTPIDGLKGIIYYRKDTIQNVECWYDFRNVKFRRWLVGATAWISGGSYNVGVVSENSSILYKCIKAHSGVSTYPNLDTTNWVKWLDKTKNYSWTSDASQFNIGDVNTTGLTFTSPVDYLTFGNVDNYKWINDVHIGRIYLDYTINNFAYSSRLNNIVFNTTNDLNTCNSNSFGENCFNNTIGDSFYYNTIGDYFNSNTIGNNFNYNTIGNWFQLNTIGDYFNSNTIGNDFYYNTIGDSFYYNTIGNNFNYNTIGDSFRHNHVKYTTSANFTSSTHVYNIYNCEIIINSSAELKLIYMNGTTYTVVGITD